LKTRQAKQKSKLSARSSMENMSRLCESNELSMLKTEAVHGCVT